MKDNEILGQLLHLVDNPANLGKCKHCQRPLKRKSNNGRLPTFCSVNCRVANWRAKQKSTSG